MSSQFAARRVIVKKAVNKLFYNKRWRWNANLGLGKADPWQLLQVVCSDIPCCGLPYSMWWRGMALQSGLWSCSFWKGRLWRVDYCLWPDHWKLFGLFCFLHLFMLWAKPLFKKLILTFNILLDIITYVMTSYRDVNIKCLFVCFCR